MLQAQHIFSHQHQYPQSEPSWLHQQQQQQQQQPQPQQQSSQQQQQPPQQQQHSHQAAQAHAQAQAAAAAAALAQQHHYNRIAASNNVSTHNLHGDRGQASASLENGVSEENRRVLGWIAELMNGNSREAALLELSKKREQVPELALILWHSFGKSHLHPFWGLLWDV